MITDDRLANEKEHHDQQALERASRYDDLAKLRFADSDYLDHEPWIRPAIDLVDPCAGKTILDYGCGHGMASVVMVRRGARVIGFDLSGGYIAEAKRRAIANEVECEFLQANGEALPFRDETFDAVFGCAILHHLDLQKAGRELLRVLKPGGIAIFCEPWGGNPLLEFARKYLPYPGKDRTPDERPLRDRDVAVLKTIFPSIELRGFQLFGIARRVFRRESKTGGWIDRFDNKLIARFPKLNNWCRYVVTVMRRC